jgi:hypothetical protein
MESSGAYFSLSREQILRAQDPNQRTPYRGRHDLSARNLAGEEESTTCFPPPGVDSALTRDEQAGIGKAYHPVCIPERGSGLGKLLPELGLVLRARRSP